MKKKLIATFFLCMLFLSSMTSNVFAAYKWLAVPAYQQEKSRWCWDACDKSIIQYCIGSSLSQTDLCIMLFGNSNDQGATIEEARSLLSKNNVFTNIIYSALSFSTLQTQINYGYPMWARLQNGISGHANVIRGYDNSTNRVSYCEPNDGSWQYMSYSSYCDGIHNDGSFWTWNATIYDCHKSR